MPKKTNRVIVRDNPMEIETDRGMEDVIELLNRGVETVRVKIHGNQFYSVKVEEIPVSGYHLECGCVGKGIAVDTGMVFFCAKHNDHKAVVDVSA